MDNYTPTHAAGNAVRTLSLRATAPVFEPRRSILPTRYPGDVQQFQASAQIGEWGISSPGEHGWTGNTAMTHPEALLEHADQCIAPLIEAVQTPDVQVGQVLTPSLSPGKKNVNWLLKNLDGTETPIRFGRAPPPPVPDVYTSMPTSSPTSDTTSALQTPHNIPGWRIGSARAYNPYGWKGGDGREISFIGYGPHAERDPNTVVDFDFRGMSARFATAVSNGFADAEENRSPFVAPKSQRQWAEKLGYSKVPCGNVKINDAVEHMPFASNGPGYCYDCVGR